MASGPAQPQQNAQPPEASQAHEWYAVTADGASALRIAPGLTVGEAPSGALAVNEPGAALQWIEFDLSESGEPSVMVITRERSLLVDGVAQMRHRLTVGASLRLPNNTLHISRDMRMPRTSGPPLEVVARQVPGRPQDLVGPGWQEALEAVRGAKPGDAEADPAVLAAGLEPEGSDANPEAGDRGRRAEEVDRSAEHRGPPPEDPDDGRDDGAVAWRGAPPAPMVTVSEPRPARRRSRRPARSKRPPMALYVTAAVLVPVAIFAVLVRVGGPGAEAPPSELSTDPRVAARDPATSAVEPQQTAQRPSERGIEPTEPAAETAGSTPALQRDVPVSEPAEQLPPVREEADPADMAAPNDAASPGPREALADPESLPAEPASDEPAQSPGGQEMALLPESTADVDEAPAAAPDMRSAPEPDQRLGRARALLEAGYITYPPQDNAVSHVRQVLAADPNNPQALELLAECTSRLIEAAERAHDQGLDYEARNTLEEVLGFDPDNQEANRLWRQWVGANR